MSRNDSKITVLQMIRDKKDILFGAFSDRLSKDKKIEEWKNVLTCCQSLGLVPTGKDYTYVRDAFYSNLKRSTLSKRDNARKTGTGGGKKSTLNPIDELILEIIGKDSPIKDGINVGPTISELQINQNDVPESSQIQTKNQNGSTTRNVNGENTIKIVRKGSKRHADILDQETKKNRKLDLQLEFLELQNYKMKLEILEMEQKLEIKPSKYTEEIKATSNENKSSQFLLISSDNLILNEDGIYSEM